MKQLKNQPRQQPKYLYRYAVNWVLGKPFEEGKAACCLTQNQNETLFLYGICILLDHKGWYNSSCLHF